MHVLFVTKAIPLSCFQHELKSLRSPPPPIPSVQAYVACSRLPFVMCRDSENGCENRAENCEESRRRPFPQIMRHALVCIRSSFVLFCFFFWRGPYYLRAWHRFHRAVDKRTLFQILSSWIVGDRENQATLFLLCATANDNRLNWRIVASVCSMVTFSSAS